MWHRGGTTKCNKCGVQLTVPPQARVVRCAVCKAVTNVGSANYHISQAVGFVNSVVANISNGINSLSSSYRSDSNGHSCPSVILPPTFPRVYGKKRALLIGISYKGSGGELEGTVNDVRCMRYLLCERFGFPAECILVLTEEEGDPYRIPTKKNILAAMHWLVRGCKSGESLVFYFSGHGAQEPIRNSDERDGFDESLCPLDCETNGNIVDDDINAILVRPLPSGVKLHAIVDACHSGTCLDLAFLYRKSRGGFYEWENHKPPSGKYTGTNGGLAILISGCDDHQLSEEDEDYPRGAMTYSFIVAIETDPSPTYGSLLTKMRSAILEINSGTGHSGPIASLLRKYLKRGSKQEPQLSSSEMFEINKKPFLL